MVKKFVETKTFTIFASSIPCRKPSWVGCLGRHIYIKGVTVRFGFDVLELRKFKLSVKNKATGTPLGCIIYIPFKMQYPFLWMDCILWDDYIYIYVGLSALLVSTDRAMRRPQHVERVTDWLRVSFLCMGG